MALRAKFFALTYDRQMAKTEKAGLRARREGLLAGATGHVLSPRRSRPGSATAAATGRRRPRARTARRGTDPVSRNRISSATTAPVYGRPSLPNVPAAVLAIALVLIPVLTPALLIR